MFSALYFIDTNDNIASLTECKYACEYMKPHVVVVSYEMLHVIDISKINRKHLCIIGSSPHLQTEYDNDISSFKTLTACIKWLSNTYSSLEWWIVCDTHLLIDLIWNGAVCNLHIIKTNEVFCKANHKLDFTIFQEPSCQFKKENLQDIYCDSLVRYKHVLYSRCNTSELALLSAMRDIVEHGSYRQNRTGVATYSTFGKTFEYYMIERTDVVSKKSLYQFPLLTTKKMFLRGIFAELKWFLSGQTDSKLLESQNVNIWKGNSSREYLDSYGFNYDEGKCGPIYGHQWRSWGAKYDQNKNNHIGEGHDQVMRCIESLKQDPFGRRHIISGWNVEQIDEMALPPCHVIYQFYVHEKDNNYYLSLSMYQRSGDTFLGIPFNIASTALFLMIMAKHVGYKPYKVVHTIGDMHIYENHIEAISKQLVRTPNMFPFAGFTCDNREYIEDYNFSDMVIEGYVSHDVIKADMVA